MIKILSLLLVLLLCSCSDEDSTTFTPAGWQNIGTLDQPLVRRVVDGATPASGTFDFNLATQLDWVGPFFVAITGWTQVEDGSAGALIFDINYDDPTGTTRIVDFGGFLVLLLNDDTSFFASPVISMVRETGSSLWELQTSLSGSAGTSEVHYEVMVSPHQPSDVDFFRDVNGDPL